MAVYTEPSDEELTAFVGRYDIGPVLAAKGIAEGVENSNFLLHTETGLHILTLYERRVRAEDLPFFLGLMEHLAARGVTCPQPVVDREGSARSARSRAGRRRSSRSSTGWACAGRACPIARRSGRRWRGSTSPARTFPARARTR